MVDYREILRLLSLKYNYSQIAEALHSFRNTIREVKKLSDEKGISWPLEAELSNQRLYGLLYPERLDKVQVYMEPDYDYIHVKTESGHLIAEFNKLDKSMRDRLLGYVEALAAMQ